MDQKSISVWLRNPEKVVENYNSTLKRLYEYNKKLNSGDININAQQMKDYKLEEVFEFMNKCWSENKDRQLTE